MSILIARNLDGRGGLLPTRAKGIATIDQTEYVTKTEELDRLLNDPDVPIRATRVWELLADLSSYAGDLATSPDEFAVPGNSHSSDPHSSGTVDRSQS